MNIRGYAVITGVMVSVLAGLALASDFEGLIRMNVTAGGRTMDMDLFTKGQKTRIEPQGQAGPIPIIIVDDAAKKSVSIMPDRKMYMESSTAAGGDMPAMAEKDDVEVVKTGKTATVSGYDCEIYLAKKKNGEETEICAAKGLPDYMGVMGMGRSDMGRRAYGNPKWMRDLIKQGLFPVRMIARKMDGAEAMRMEVTKVEQKPLDESLFVVPAGYTKFDMDAMRGKGKPEGAPPAGH